MNRKNAICHFYLLVLCIPKSVVNAAFQYTHVTSSSHNHNWKKDASITNNKHYAVPFDKEEISLIDKLLDKTLQEQQPQQDQIPFVKDISDTISSIFNFEKFDDILTTKNAAGFSSVDIPSVDILNSVNNDVFLSELSTKIQDFYTSFLSLDYASTIAISFLVTAFGAGLLFQLSAPPTNYRDGYEPYDRGEYNPDVARVYYSKHPFLVLRRFLQILRVSNNFLLKIFIDTKIKNTEKLNRSERAKELLELIQNIGPTAIKIGQAISVRPDLIAYEYANTLATLQDRVTPFDSKKAKDVLDNELIVKRTAVGTKSLSEVFTDTSCFDKKPVASASIGQVYKATLRNTDQDVAVKIQRPNALAEIALDLYIVREFLAPIYKKYTNSGTDYVALANEWGRGFIAELDYNQEMYNTKKFQNDMIVRKLNDVVTSPTVIDNLCTDRILVTEWIDGTRLDEATDDSDDDVTRLCSVALNAYLIMLLETGTLHCDPHPGNLFKDKDGKLVILDFGMTLDTSPTLQYDLLEFIAHLTGRDYEKIPEDLVALQFLKADSMDDIRRSGFLEPLTYMLQQATEGGGRDKIRERIFEEFREKYPGLPDDELRVKMRADMAQRMVEVREKESAITGITLEVEELQRRNQKAFSIPEWFLYTSRAFLTLEGISLQANEDYSLIKSCFPYVAKRLLNDDSERAQTALRDLLYGAGQYVSGDRLLDLTEGFSTYVATTKTKNIRPSKIIDAGLKNDEIKKTPRKHKKQIEKELESTAATITLVKDTADVLLAEEGNLLQNILVNETAAIVTASAKDLLRDLLIDRPLEVRKQLPFGDRLPQPMFKERFIKPFLTKTEDEAKAQDLVQRLAPRQQTNERTVPYDGDINKFLEDVEPEQVALILKELRQNLPRYSPLVSKLSGKFASAVYEKSRNEFEKTLADIQQQSNNKLKT